MIAERFATDHHRILIPHSDLLSPLEAAVHAMAEPMVSHDAVAFYLLSEAVARHLKVVQSGQGADEILGGYHWYPPLAGVPREDAVGTLRQGVLRSRCRRTGLGAGSGLPARRRPGA